MRRPGQFGREYVMERGHRSQSRYYGPGGAEEEEEERRRHAPHRPAYKWGQEEEEEEEGHYEGPTIFDKVFRKSAQKSKDTSR